MCSVADPGRGKEPRLPPYPSFLRPRLYTDAQILDLLLVLACVCVVGCVYVSYLFKVKPFNDLTL